MHVRKAWYVKALRNHSESRVDHITQLHRYSVCQLLMHVVLL